MYGDSMKLNVVLRDNLISTIHGCSPQYRLAQIELTEEQANKIRPQKVGIDGGVIQYEFVDRVFLQQD